jgi:hypothetical protein
MLRSIVPQRRRSGSRKRHSVRRASLEPLEDRILLSFQFPNLQVNDPQEDGRSAQDTHSETTLVVGANHTVVVAYNDTLRASDNPSQMTSYAQSTDGGITFVDKRTLPVSADGDAGDPVLAADNLAGRIYLSSLTATGPGINVYRSDDNGATFKAPVNGAPRADALWDKDWLDLTAFLAAHEGQTLRLRFAVADNLYIFLLGVDRIILGVNSSQGGAAALGRGKLSSGRLASASSAGIQGAALLLGSRSTEVVLLPPATTSLPGPALAPIPDIDRFFGSTVTNNEAHVFKLARSEQVDGALEGPWREEALNEISAFSGPRRCR